MKNNTKKMAYVTMFSAMAILLNIIESTFIPPVSFGIRFGIANIISLVTIQFFGYREMIVVNVLRILIGNLLKGLIFGSTFWISTCGVVLSSIALILLKKINSSILFSSIISSIMHSIGQIVMVMFFYQQFAVITYLPILFFTSIPTGVLTGFIAQQVLHRIKLRV